MILTGIADEAGADINTQIKAHKELDWNHIELRLINGRNIAGEITDLEFDQVYKALSEDNMEVTGFASRIANWSRHINDDFQLDVEDLKTSIPRMKKLRTEYIRVMSWKGDGVEDRVWFQEARMRLKELSRIAENEGIYLLHENCEGWGGLSAKHMLDIKSAVDSPNFLLMYDIGNTISHGYEPWSFFETIRHNFDYIHIKDVKMNPDGGRSNQFTFCGQGDARLKDILTIIINEDKYDGILSIEPHVSSVVHLSGGSSTPEKMYESYLEYGKLSKRIIQDIKANG